MWWSLVLLEEKNKLLQRFHELIEKIKNESEDKECGKEKDKQKSNRSSNSNVRGNNQSTFG
jgi:hypothetical protein